MAAYITSESTVKKFLNNGYPYFSFYANGLKIASNENASDIDEASEKLRDELLTYENNQLSSWDDKIIVYTFADKNVMLKAGKTDISHKCSAALTVRFPDKRQDNTYKTDSSFQVLQILQEMRNDMNIQREKIASLEAELQDDYNEDDDDSNPIIGALKSNPELMNTIVTGAMSALGNIFKKPSRITALGSIEVDQEEKLAKSIEILKANDDKLSDHLEILANMSIENPGQFKWLISMLNKKI
jgi:hypothetical protein